MASPQRKMSTDCSAVICYWASARATTFTAIGLAPMAPQGEGIGLTSRANSPARIICHLRSEFSISVRQINFLD